MPEACGKAKMINENAREKGKPTILCKQNRKMRTQVGWGLFGSERNKTRITIRIGKFKP